MSEPTSPRVSVLMPVYNEEGRAGRALDSVLQQTYPSFEVVVVDDGSTDRTGDVLGSFEHDRRVRVVRFDENQGLVAALNHGLSLCRGRLVARLDADDVCAPTRLERQVAVFDEFPDTAICATAYDRVSASGEFLRIGVPPLTHAALAVAMLAGNRILHASIMFDSTLLRAVGGYDEAWFPVEDYDLWLRIMRVGTYRGLPTPEVTYTVNPEGISATRAAEQHRAGIERAISYCVELTGRSSRVHGDAELPISDLVRSVRVLRRRLRRSGIPTKGLDRQALLLANAALRGKHRVFRAARVLVASPRIAINGRLRRAACAPPSARSPGPAPR